MTLSPSRLLLAAAIALAFRPVEAAPSFVNGLTLDGAALDLSGGASVNNGTGNAPKGAKPASKTSTTTTTTNVSGTTAPSTPTTTVP